MVAVIVAITGLLAVLIPLLIAAPKLIKEFRALKDSNHSLRESNEAQIVSNSTDHAFVVEALHGLTATVERVDTRLTDHITWHAHQAPTPPVTQSVVVNPKEEVAA